MKLIGISGKKESGKDTVGKMIADMNRQFRRAAFGDPIKKIAAELTGSHVSLWHDRDFKESFWSLIDMTPRAYLQRLGETLRLFDDEVFIKATFNNMHESQSYVVTDVRFKNEADAIKKRGGFLIRVERPGIATSDHISETDLDNYRGFNVTINNNGTINHLFDCVGTAYRSYNFLNEYSKPVKNINPEY